MKIREKMVTRTVTTLVVNVIGFDADDTPKTYSFEIPEIDEKKILPYIAEMCGDKFTPAKVRNITKQETLYGMSESTFLAHAEKLPPRNANNVKEEG